MHTMIVRGYIAMTFRTNDDEPVVYSSNGIEHYAHQGDRLVASFSEPEWMRHE